MSSKKNSKMLSDMIQRKAKNYLKILTKEFKAVAVVGPRQSGKTTLVRETFKRKPYVSLENPDIQKFALEDPRGFLADFPNGAIIDEAQRVPQLFAYLQQILDETKTNGKFILTGSNNFLLQENISQSLSGRVGYLFLLPLSLQEVKPFGFSTDELLYRGGYPALYKNNSANVQRFYSNYIRTYVERDVRLLKNITNLYTFEKFLHLCAGRIGSLINTNSLASEVGVDNKTIASWIGILEASFILFRLPPFYKNYNKRIVKMSKLYFYDVGLASALLGITSSSQLRLHPLRGNLFENLIVSEFLKRRYNKALSNNLFFWRDNTGNEIDLLLDSPNDITAIEIKSGQTINEEFFKGIHFWNKTTKTKGGNLVYGGEIFQQRTNGIKTIPYTQLDKIKI